MTILSTAFIFTFINIHSIKEDNEISQNLYIIDYPNKYTRPICNIIVWQSLLNLFNKENFITVNDIVNMFKIIDPDKIKSTCKIISTDNTIYFSDFNNFLHNLKESDYNTLISYISKDDLSTPTDWSIIDSDSEPTDNETEDSEPTDNETEDSEPTDNETADSEATDNETEDSESTDNKKIIHLEETDQIINPLIKFYDPNLIVTPKLTLRNKPQHYIEYKVENKKDDSKNTQTQNEETKKYSWYMNYLIELNEYFKCFWVYDTISSYIKVPTWVKKYF